MKRLGNATKRSNVACTTCYEIAKVRLFFDQFSYGLHTLVHRELKEDEIWDKIIKFQAIHFRVELVCACVHFSLDFVCNLNKSLVKTVKKQCRLGILLMCYSYDKLSLILSETTNRPINSKNYSL